MGGRKNQKEFLIFKYWSDEPNSDSEEPIELETEKNTWVT